MTNDIPDQPTTPPATPPPPSEPPTVPAPEVPKKRLSPLTAGLLGLAAGAGLTGGIWAITANSGPDTFTLEGAFALTEDARVDGDDCSGGYDSGYDDISVGTSVTVYGASGDVIATGQLGDSTYESYSCVFDIAVPDVPRGERFYKVEVSHRGTVQLTAKEAENGDLFASLG